MNGKEDTPNDIEPVDPAETEKRTIAETLYLPFRSELFLLVFGAFIIIVAVAYFNSYSFILERNSMISMLIMVIGLYIFEIVDPSLDR